ncbi:MAG TPA: hypothetical protein VJ111_10950 [Chitinophagaceae bacterium]|nr:hypothetical protein [Chitinophagaceae bacterium]
MKRLNLLFFLSSTLLSSCWDFRNNVSPEPPVIPPKKVWGYKPVFTVDSSILKISATGPQTVKLPGKIYVKANLIFQNDLGSGIHVIDNSNSSAPHPIGFIKILGNSEISIKGDMLYANSFMDLVVVDVKDWQKATEVKRIKDAFHQGAQAGRYSSYNFIPLPEHGVYYECLWIGRNDVAHIQTGWVRDSVYDNNCYYQ